MSKKDDERFVKSYRLCQVFTSKGLSGQMHLRRTQANARPRLGQPRDRQLLCGRAESVLDSEEDFDPRRHLAELCPQCRDEYEAAARQFHGLPTVGRLVF